MVETSRAWTSNYGACALLTHFGIACLAGFYSIPALAQTAETAPQTSGMEEIVVTAQKREEAIFTVPITITAYGAKFLDINRIQRFDDLAPFVPGLEVSPQSANDTGFSIRGITTDSGSANEDTRVSIFFDGVSFSRSRGSVMEFYDVDRIEVLKGPQETLFGRGAEIGAISIIAKKPVDEFDASLTAGGGNYGAWELEGYVNVPVNDKILLRLAADKVHREPAITASRCKPTHMSSTVLMRSATSHGLTGDSTTLPMASRPPARANISGWIRISPSRSASRSQATNMIGASSI